MSAFLAVLLDPAVTQILCVLAFIALAVFAYGATGLEWKRWREPPPAAATPAGREIFDPIDTLLAAVREEQRQLHHLQGAR